ncbi:MAG TPA: hypothetical protein VF173_14730 [Thermoanaerobaculia bacterium]|nr:hypothetical protein [Thermoanaerobaculia bacterium]
MKDSPALLLASLLLWAPAMATAGESPRFLPDRTPEGTAAPVSAGGALLRVDNGERLYYSLPGQLAPGTHELRFEIRVEGRLRIDDKLQLPADAAGGSVELLAGDTVRQRQLFELAAGSNRTEVRVTLDGRLLRTLSLPELAAASRRLQLSLLVLRSPLSEHRSYFPAAGSGAAGRLQRATAADYDPHCIDDCGAAKVACYASEPECEGLRWCPACEDQYDACFESCRICTDPVSVNTEYVLWTQTTSPAGSACVFDGSCSSLYSLYSYYVEHCLVQVTTYCSGRVDRQSTGICDSTSGTCGYYAGSCSFGSYGSAPDFCPN